MDAYNSLSGFDASTEKTHEEAIKPVDKIPSNTTASEGLPVIHSNVIITQNDQNNNTTVLPNTINSTQSENITLSLTSSDKASRRTNDNTTAHVQDEAKSTLQNTSQSNNQINSAISTNDASIALQVLKQLRQSTNSQTDISSTNDLQSIQNLPTSAMLQNAPSTSMNYLQNLQLLQSLRPSQLAKIISPVDPVGSLLDAAKNLGVDGDDNSKDILGNKKSTENSKPKDAGEQSPNFLAGLLDNVNKLKAQLQMQIMSSDVPINEQSKLSSSKYNTDSSEFPSKQTVDPSGRSVDGGNKEESLPEDSSESSPSTMEAAADATGSRNVGESRLASALSALGIPDAGATGIASLMAAGFIAAGANQRREATLKLGLAAKLAKSIADLGGRGAASAAGLASLSELLKDGRDMSTVRLADQIGQALQRVGGAGAAVGYAALAASLKAVGDKPKPGALIGGIVLALAEQGSAPGTAGLAALAAGLGGSGADALAGGLGGTLPNVITASKTNNYMTNLEGGGGGGGGYGGGGDASSAALVGGGIGLGGSSSANTDAEYTGQGPAGSSSQSLAGGGMHGHHFEMDAHHIPEMASFTHHGNCRDGICKQPSSSKESSLVDMDKMISDRYGAKGDSVHDIAEGVVRSSTDDDGASRLPVSVGGGELVNTDNPDQPSCQMKRSMPPSCK